MLGRLRILASVKKSKHCFFKVVFFSSLAYVLAFFGTVHAGPVERMAEALRFETVSFQNPDKINYQAFADFLAFIEQTYPRVFSTLSAERFSDYSLLLTWRGSQPELAPVLLDAHYDVVPIEQGTLQDWLHPPFAGVVADGYLWGRGALDDKMAVITSLEALERLLAAGYTPERTLYFSMVHDEEIGGHQGAAVVASALHERGVKFAYMVGEGGIVLPDNPMLAGKSMALVGLAEKTYITLHLTASGEGGHSSIPPRNNAAVSLARAVTKIHDNPLPVKLVEPVTDMLRVMGPEVGGLTGWLMRNQWLGAIPIAHQMAGDRTNNALVRSTSAVTMLDSGVKENVVPQKAHAVVNMRLLPGDKVDEVVASIVELIDDENIVVKLDSWGQSPPVADLNGEGYARISEAAARVFPESLIVPGMLTATTDTRHYQLVADEVYRFRAYRVSMSDSRSIHATNERLATDSLLRAIDFTEQLVLAVAKP